MRNHAKVYALFLLILIYLPGVCVLIHVGRSDEYIRTIEKRELHPFPTLGSSTGQILAELPSWFAGMDLSWSDRFPFRGKIIELSRNIDLRLGRSFFGNAVVGRNGWMYYREDSGKRLGSTPEVDAVAKHLECLLGASATYEKPIHVVFAPPKQVVYPEHLGLVESAAVAENAFTRSYWDAMLRRFPPSFVLPLFENLTNYKESSTYLLYDPRDTHHSSIGSMVMAETIIDAIAPGLWSDSEIAIHPSPSGGGDLPSLIGIVDVPPSTRPVASLARKGIQVTQVSGPDPTANSGAMAQFRATSKDGAGLIPGRTLVIRDSFIYSFLHPTLAQFFADVTFVHYDEVDGSRFWDFLRDYDRIVIECAEREAGQVLRKIASTCKALIKGEILHPFRQLEVLANWEDFGFVDQIQVNPDSKEINIFGWAPVDMLSSRTVVKIWSPFFIADSRNSLEITGVSRPDVQKAFPAKNLSKMTGFSVRWRIEGDIPLPALAQSLQVLCSDSFGRTFRLHRSTEGSNGLFLGTNHLSCTTLAATSSGIASTESAGYIERVLNEPSDPSIFQVQGWVPFNCNSPLTTLIIELPQAIESTSIIDVKVHNRPDMASATDSAPPYGFTVTLRTSVPLSELLLNGRASLYTIGRTGGPPMRLTALLPETTP